MNTSSCTVSFFRNDLQRTKLKLPGKCPVKNCSSSRVYKVAVNKKSQVPFCPEHGIRVHSTSFVYYNGSSKDALITALKRNLFFNPDYYVKHFFGKGNKMEGHRLCYESSEDALSYNVFSALLADKTALKKLTTLITGEKVAGNVDLYLWGNKIDIVNDECSFYQPLMEVRELLEKDIAFFKTEPDIMLVVPGKVVICIEAKFGSKNPVAKDEREIAGNKPKKLGRLIERYYERNDLIKPYDIFDFGKRAGRVFYEQLFRNIVFAASMAHLENTEKWYVVNLRNEHVMNLKKGKPESAPVMRNMRAIMKPGYKKRFAHLTWEEIYKTAVKDNPNLDNLSWYLKNKSLKCGRAFNII